MRKYALLMLICIVGISLFAYETGTVLFGGLTTSWAGGDLDESDAMMGFHIGASMEHFGVVQNAIIETGVRYNLKGFEMSWDTYYGDYVETYNFHYIDVFAKAKLDIGTLPIYPYFGAYSAILLSATCDWDLNGESGTVDVDDYVNAVDFGLLFGADFVIQDKFYLGVGFDLGLSNFLDSPAATGATRAVMFSAGYMF